MSHLADRIRHHLWVLVEEIGARPPGSPANRRATDHAVATLTGAGLQVRTLPFTTRWWTPGPTAIEVSGTLVPVPPPPFGRPCDVVGSVVRLSMVTELEQARPMPDNVLVIDGELTTEPLFPKAFPFLDLPEQRTRIAQLERLAPVAVVAVVTTRGPYSFFEDPDLAFPYCIVDPSIGARLAGGMAVRVRVGGTLQEGAAVNVSATGGPAGPRTVISAHIDSKVTTPGALDNAGGAAVLLALAETGSLGAAAVELVLFNGEDHFDAPGEQAWLAATDLGTVTQAVNVDGAGYRGRGSTVAPMACPPAMEGQVEVLVAARPGWAIAPPWYESDHAVFAMRGIPSLAITSDGIHDLLADIAHTEHDTLAIVDPERLADVASFIAAWVGRDAPRSAPGA